MAVYSLLAPRRAAVHGNGASEQPPRCLPLRSQFQLRNARAFFRCFASCSGLFLYPASHSSPAQIDDINLPSIACYKHIAGRATSRYRKSESLALRQVCVAAVRPAPLQSAALCCICVCVEAMMLTGEDGDDVVDHDADDHGDDADHDEDADHNGCDGRQGRLKHLRFFNFLLIVAGAARFGFRRSLLQGGAPAGPLQDALYRCMSCSERGCTQRCTGVAVL